MTTITTPVPVRVTPTGPERMLLALGRRLEQLAVARMRRRALAAASSAGLAHREADDRHRSAEALGAFGILPR